MSNPDPRPSSKREKLAELEHLIAEQDERTRRQAIEQTGRIQLALLRAHLLKLGVLDPDEFAEKAQGNWWIDPDTAELRTWFVIDGSAYYEKGGVIYVEREARGNGNGTRPWQSPESPR
jgi:hypothetical protein